MAQSALWRIRIGFLACCLFAACGPSTSTSRRDSDLAFDTDSGIRSPDLAAPGDLAFSGTLLRFVVNRIDLPSTKGQYGTDENGDNTVDNQLAVLLGALGSLNGGAGFSFMQASQNIAITVDGSALELLSLATLDPSATEDPNAFATLYAGSSQKFPELDGSGSFGVDPSGGAGRVDGTLSQAVFTAKDPARRDTDVTAPLRLGFWSSKQATLPLHGVHVVFAVSGGALTGGQIHGVLSAADVQKVMVATLAADFTAIEARANCATDADCRTVQKVLDLDGNGMVDADEINQGPLGPSLRPDVEMFDAMGRYAPSPANANRNAWSVGVAFTAVKASFAER